MICGGWGGCLPAEDPQEFLPGRFADDAAPLRRGDGAGHRLVRFFRDHFDVPHDFIGTVEFLLGLPRKVIRVEPHDPAPERPRAGWNDAVGIV